MTTVTSDQQVPRRVLLDMHVPDWEPWLLGCWDPGTYVDVAAAAGATEVTIYTQSHLGLAYWPTPVGPVHAACQGRDWVEAALRIARRRGIAARGYYSLTQNNWAYRERPDWRTSGPLRYDGGYPGPRYGLVCFRNPEYRSFTVAQLTDLVASHRFDSFFFDLTFLSPVCACRHCARRFASAGLGPPATVVDWRDPRWHAQRRISELDAVAWAHEVTDLVHHHQAGVPVQHNFTAAAGLTFGAPLDAVKATSHPAADFYGDRAEQLAVASLFDTLTGRLETPAPAEFMTSIALHVTDGVELKTEAELESAVALAVAANGAPTLIDAVRPDGSVNVAQYGLVARSFESVAHARWSADSAPVADVGVYVSDVGRADVTDNGRSAYEVTWGGHSFPHFRALKGAVQALAREHLAFRVVTSRELAETLPRFVVVPRSTVLSVAEREALLGYAAAGGHLYVSADTGSFLVDDEGTVPHASPPMASLVGMEPVGPAAAGPAAPDGVTTFTTAPPVYLRPLGDLASVLGAADGIRVDGVGTPSAPELPAEVEVLAVFDLPMTDVVCGLHEPRGWVSVHHDPPVRRGVAPALVQRPWHAGSLTYSAVPLEMGARRSHEALFRSLVRRAVGTPAIDVRAAESVWLFARTDPDGLVVRLADTDDRTSEDHQMRAVLRLPGAWQVTTAGTAEVDVSRDRDASGPVTEVKVCHGRRFAELRLTSVPAEDQ